MKAFKASTRACIFAALLLAAATTRAADPLPPQAELQVAIDGEPVEATVQIAITTAPGASRSPTGREPALLWTPGWQAAWERARQENHPWWRYIKGRADLEKPNYHDQGQFPLAVYQITGEAAYGRKALERVSDHLGRAPSSTNDQREQFAKNVLMYDWLRPCLTAQEHQAFHDTFGLYLEHARQHTRLSDSDEAAGNYFGIALLAVSTDDSRAWELLNQGTVTDYDRQTRVGGLSYDPSAGPRDTLRNAIGDFIRLSEGGEYLESSQYNRRSVPRLLVGWHGLRTATSQDTFPEIAGWLEEYCLASMHMFTPDLRAVYQWGDVERDWAHKLDYLEFETTQRALAAALLPRQHALWKPYQGFLRELYSRPRGGELMREAILVLDPYADSQGDGQWRTAAGLEHYCAGQRILLARDGWTADSTLLGCHFPGHNKVDHPLRTFGDFHLYRRGEWVVSHPLTYDGTGKPEGCGSTHAMLLANLPPVFAERKVTAHGSGESGGAAHHWIVGRCGGAFTAHKNPPEFLRDWTRSIVWLAGKQHASDVLLIRDHVAADAPQVGVAKHWHGSFRDRIGEFAAGETPLVQLVVHARDPIRQATGGSFTWQTPGGQRARLVLLKTEGLKAVLHGPEYWQGRLAQWQMGEAERRWHVRLGGGLPGGEAVFIHAITVCDAAGAAADEDVPSEPSLEVDASGAVRVRRADHRDAVIRFDDGCRPLIE